MFLIYTSLLHRMVAPKFSNNLACLSAAVGVAPCGSHSSSSSSSSSEDEKEQEVALRHVLNKLDLERDVHPPLRTARPHTVWIQSACCSSESATRQTETVDADKLITSPGGGREESFARKVADLLLVLSPGEKLGRT